MSKMHDVAHVKRKKILCLRKGILGFVKIVWTTLEKNMSFDK